MKIKNRIRAGIVLLALALGLTACGGSSSSTASSAASSAPASSVSESVSAEPESTSAAPESAVNTEASPLDGIKFSVSKVRNDNTGNWRISLIAEKVYEEENAFLEFVIRDTGMGIAEADRSRIFEAFERGRSAKNVRKEGLGLGLALLCSLWMRWMEH